jgi:hypothetical protein
MCTALLRAVAKRSVAPRRIVAATTAAASGGRLALSGVHKMTTFAIQGTVVVTMVQSLDI